MDCVSTAGPQPRMVVHARICAWQGADRFLTSSIMFMPDQLRYDSLGCTGNPVIQTPRFDALAKEGTLFTSELPARHAPGSADAEDCFTQASVCTQSRCSMFTGQYLHTSAHRSLDNMLKPWEDNMFKCLKEAGYHVCSISPRGGPLRARRDGNGNG